ncbi:hypothetical protein C1H46_008061 [Malus baccata]|uniref:Pentacotripeptide-repeat region of PRORP domain-containing protein n=1 Tax=Malus baccata TaxID=106549 RepID=A0A540N733_MALBA|nr:hypothetical protein C1H46_008061 [Malus baccata]
MPNVLGVEAHFFFFAQLQVSNLHSPPTVSTCSTQYNVRALQTHRTPDPDFGSRSLTTAALRRAPMSADLRHVHPSLKFLPFANNPTSKSLCSVKSNERRKVTVGLSRIIKNQSGYALKGFSRGETAFGFLKLAFRDDSEGIVRRSCCIAAHFLAGYNLRFLAQDVVSFVIARIGPSRSIDLVGFMWRGHCEYESDFSVLDTLMRGCLNAEMGAEALEVVSRMREVGSNPSLSAIAILLRKGLITVGESLLHVMWKFQCDPDGITYNILINANCERGQADDALHWVHLMIARACKPSTVTFSTIINVLCKEGNMVEARKIFYGIPDMGISPSTTIYNTMMDGYVKARDIGQANMIYEEMRNKGISPDGITFNILIAGHYKYGREEDGDRLLKDISVSGLLPDSSLYDIMVSGLCWAGRLDDAIEFLEDTLGKGLALSVVAFNSLLQLVAE